MASSSCAEHASCTALELVGECCPTDDGKFLSCCDGVETANASGSTTLDNTTLDAAPTSNATMATALLDAYTTWAADREWAVHSFVALSGIALACVLVRFMIERRQAAKAMDAGAPTAEFRAFQRSYLRVFIAVMLADWMQGTHMYTLYKSYEEDNPEVSETELSMMESVMDRLNRVSTSSLFFLGFIAAGLLGTFTGPLVDRYGRKRACLVYVALELLINGLEHINSMPLLMLGRVLGGVSTSLLFSAFEAWMVTEHRRRGFPDAWLGETFGLCAVWNGATAVVAGFAAQLAADKLGDIGPFQVAMCLTALAGALMTPWAENYGGGPDAGAAAAPPPDAVATTATAAKSRRSKSPARARSPKAAAPAPAPAAAAAPPPEGLVAAWHTVRQSRALLLVGLCYALFEGAMYTFVFNWVPVLAAASGGNWEAFGRVQGLLFSCLMAAISIGGELYNLAYKLCGAERVEAIGVAVYACACGCMAALVWCSCTDCGSFAFLVQFGACLGFEVCVGAFQPCIATHRSKYVPDALQSTVNNLFRFPLNMLVAAGTMASDYFSFAVVFGICAGAHAVATLCQLMLAASRQRVKVD